MAHGIDLKPLSEETISEMGYQSHDLWLVKINHETFGPYETESLKHYVGDNEVLFEEAQASRMDDIQWKPFWDHVVFQRRKIQAAAEAHEGPFWILDNGLKIGPLAFRDVDKKIEMGILGMTDHISVDNGETWRKIYEIAGFDRRTYDPDSLPIAPLESEFQKAKLALVEKMEQPRFHTSDELAEMAHIGQQQAKVIQFRAEEMTLNTPRETHVSESLKWAVPTAAAVILTIFTTGYFMFQTEDEAVVIAEGEVEVEVNKEKPFYQKPKKQKIVRGSLPDVPTRRPASVSYGSQAPSYERQPSYPTHMETHESYNEPQERDPLDGPVMDAEQAPQEHSLVNSQDPGDQSLDAAMNGVVQPEQPIVEEASDF